MNRSMKRLAAFTLSLILLLALLPGGVLAADTVASGKCGAEGSNVKWSLNSAGTLTISGKGKMMDFAAPSDWTESYFKPDFLPKIPDADASPWGELPVKRVVIKTGVTAIGSGAFRHWDSLTSVTIPESVTSIGGGAFGGCTKLKNVVIPESVTSIGEGAFSGCTALTSITIPASIKKIGFNVFAYCSGLTSVTIPEGVESIEQHAFLECTSLTDVTIPESVTNLGYGAFSYCPALGRVRIPANTKLGGYVFRGSGSEFVVDEGNPNYLSIDGVIFDKNDMSLYACPVAKAGAYSIPEGASANNPSAFLNCTSLTSITIPANAYVYTPIFNTCAGLEAIYVDPGHSQICSVDGVLFSKDMTELLCYPRAKQGAYTVPAGVTTIGEFAFLDCTGLTEVVIPEGVTEVSGFNNCSSLTSVTLPDSVTSFGGFINCESLTSVTLPEGLESVCFENCGSLKDITIPEGANYVSIKGCGSLTTLTIPDGVESVCFGGCSSLESLILPDSVAYLQESAFSGCSSLKSLTIPANVEVMAWYYERDGFFNDCTSLTEINVAEKNQDFCSVDGVLFDKDMTTLLAYPAGRQGAYVIPEGVSRIGQYAFFYCSGLTKVSIPKSVTEIGKAAFAGCSGLTKLTVPGSVETFGPYAFYGCSALTDVTFSKGVTAIGNYAFWRCGSLQNLTLPQSMETIGIFAFYECSSLAQVSIPTSVSRIGYAAFDTGGMKDVYYEGDSTGWEAINFGSNGYGVWQDPAMVSVTLHFGGSSVTPLNVDSVKADKSSAKVGEEITWTAAASGGSGSLSYRFFVYRGSTVVYKGSFGKDSVFSYTPAEAGDYKVKVFVRDADGTVNLTGGKVTVQAAKPGAISKVTAKASAGKITVSWTASEGAASYMIQRKAKGETKWTTLKSGVKGLSYEDTAVTAGTSYQYRVRGKNAAGAGAYKASAAVEALAAAKPGAISKVTVKATAGKITVKWTASEGAASYVVQRRVKGESKWTTLKSNVKGTSYADTTAEAGVTYQYRVRGRSGKLYGTYKASSSVTAKAA